MNTISRFHSPNLFSARLGVNQPNTGRLTLQVASPQFKGGDEFALQNADTVDRYQTLLRLTPHSPVSNAYVEKVSQGLDSLPEVVRRALETHGWKIILATLLSEADPHLKDARPQGSDVWSTADNSTGVTFAPNIFLAEKVWHRKPKGVSKLAKMKLFPCTRPVEPPINTEAGILAHNIAADRILRHEVGHAVDNLLRRPSQSEAFQKAYRMDLQKLSDEEREAVYYYIQPDQVGLPTIQGKREAFAEAFAVLYGGGQYSNEHFKAYFPNVLQYVEKTIQDWEARHGRLPSVWEQGPPASLVKSSTY